VHLSAAESAEIVGELRRARRRQRVAAIHWVDALYQVYVTAIVAVVGVVLISGVVGDGEISAASVADVRAHGPAVAGLLAALAVFMGLRSGSRGGPLALERPDVRHVLLAPVDRGVALRGPAWRQLRFLAAVGAAVGATAGQLALRRLPGNPAEWMAVGAAFGVVVVALGFGSALLASGTGLRSWVATLGGGLLVAWSAADAFDAHGPVPVAPGTLAGRLAIWPLRTDPIALVGVAVAVALVVAGMRLVAGLSLEAAERRTALVGQLRFAVTLQDLRTVLVLRRQLAQERPRSRPWLPARRRARHPVLQRGLRSFARWPASRLVRVGLCAVVAGLALRGVWSGTTPLLLLAGVALWIAALDAVEPLGQEVDHPSRTDAFPLARGSLYLAHLPAVAIVTSLSGAAAGIAASVPLGSPVPVGPALVAGITGGILAGCGAVVSVIQGAPDAVDVLAITTPEIAGSRTVLRTAWPPGLAVAGTLPLLAARAAERGIGEPPPLEASLAVTAALGIVVALVGGWTRFHDEIHEFIRNAAEQASPTKALERAAAEREAAEQADGRGGASGGDAADEADEDAGSTGRPAAPPKPKPKTPKIGPAPEGVRGGSSAKPIGRAREQRGSSE
jgi:hypothetical protein